jgi:hypothetical protein
VTPSIRGQRRPAETTGKIDTMADETQRLIRKDRSKRHRRRSKAALRWMEAQAEIRSRS